MVRTTDSWNEQWFHGFAGRDLHFTRSDGCAARDSNPEPAD